MENGITREQQRREAADRLRILEGKGLMPKVRRDFEQGRLGFSERMNIPGLGVNGILYWISESPELEKAVRKVEEEFGVVAYHATHETFGFGEVLDIFCVSRDADEWEQDRADLKEGYSLVYSANLDCDWCSEFGTISFAARGGGLVRGA